MFYNYHEWSDDRIKEKYQEILKWSSDRTAERAGTINCYTCEKCHRSEKYYYIDSGVTPFMNTCSFCGELAQSTFGRDVLRNLPATKEWFRPELEEILKLKNSDDEVDHYKLEHYLNGGLESRKRFSGNRIVIYSRGMSKAQELVKMLSEIAADDIPIINIDSDGGFPSSLGETPPIPEPPKPLKIPSKNIPPAPKNRQQRRKEERENRKKKKP